MGLLSLFRRKARTRPREEKPAAPPPPAPATAVRAAKGGAAAPGARTVLVAPWISEKATLLGSVNQYLFRVTRDATKPAIRRAIERQYGVHVTGVRVLSGRGKVRRRGRVSGRTPRFRKAVVSLKTGERLDLAPKGP